MRKLPLLLLALCSLLLAPCSPATELTDLGQGLSYLRIHSVAGSEVALRKTVPGAGALVLDLRYATADETAAGLLKASLAGRPANMPLFVLVSPATPSALAAALAAPGAVTLGAPGSMPAPKVIVQTDAAADRRAYDALDAGTELAKLVSGKIEKDRFDEATLVKEFKDGHEDAPPPPGPTDLPGNPAERGVSGTNPGPAAAGNGASASADKPTPVPTDRVLQRAIHLHRALLALRR
jgi:hypothetical protein